ncbi:hypothetical protein TWF506_008054 [Arthrobotrys conoides]|uniref:Uncharacterized protein n=1 Tax=Arthrobotrys conoides TaxID=74498 RepID=A0AAN8RTL7_9PEZI
MPPEEYTHETFIFWFPICGGIPSPPTTGRVFPLTEEEEAEFAEVIENAHSGSETEVEDEGPSETEVVDSAEVEVPGRPRPPPTQPSANPNPPATPPNTPNP